MRPDCAQCVALCCVAPPFDAGPDFAADKPAETPCVHLMPDDRCRIHDRLVARGYPGCAAYDCHGAGPRALRLAGASWRTSPARARALFDLFAGLRPVHELLARLDALRRIAVDQRAGRDAAGLATELWRVSDHTAPLAAESLGSYRSQVEHLIARERAARGVTPPGPS